MTSRTRIPTAIYPTGHTVSNEEGETAGQVMMKSGDGSPISKQMIQDYPCGDETGHYFISSPLNVYSIGRSGSVVLYVEGGCPNFTWASDNAWATFSSATTSVRYNTIESTAAEGQDTIVTVTDANGLEVTINVPWNGAVSCCEDPPALSIQTLESELGPFLDGVEIVVFIDGGCPPFGWVITNSIDVNLDYAATNSRRNRVSSSILCPPFTLTVTDLCSQVATVDVQLGMAVQDSYEFDESNGTTPYVIQLSGEYYVVTYCGPDDDGWVKTFRVVAATGVISEIDSYEYSTSNGSRSNIIHVTGNIYALTSSAAYLHTIEISDVGVITDALEDSQLISASAVGRIGFIVHVNAGYYAMFSGTSSGELVSTYIISALGIITVVDTYAVPISNGASWACKVIDNIFFSVKFSDWGTFIIVTYEISNAGAITTPYLDRQVLTIPGVGHGANHGRAQVIEITPNIFAMTHQDDEVGATIATFQVNDDGTIESSLLDSLLFYAGNQNISRAQIVYSGSGSLYHILYRGLNGNGWIYSVEITDAGIISAYNPCGGFEFEDNYFSYMSALMAGEWLLTFYGGPDNDGWAKTIEV